MVAASALSRAASIVKATRKSDSALVGEYRYDALGRRVEKVVTGATYRYVYSGVETVSVYTSTGTWKQDYVYGEDIDEVVMLEQADLLDQDADSNTSELTRSFYHLNALGSVMEITDMSQAVAVSYRYDPYGQVTITRGGTTQTGDPLGQHVTYTGRWRDEETGLYHYRARAYDPVRGRFLQRDPLGCAVAPTLYEFVRSAPVNGRDPSGLAPDVAPHDDGSPVWKAMKEADEAGRRAEEAASALRRAETALEEAKASRKKHQDARQAAAAEAGQGAPGGGDVDEHLAENETEAAKAVEDAKKELETADERQKDALKRLNTLIAGGKAERIVIVIYVWRQGPDGKWRRYIRAAGSPDGQYAAPEGNPGIEWPWGKWPEKELRPHFPSYTDCDPEIDERQLEVPGKRGGKTYPPSERPEQPRPTPVR